MLPTLDLVVLIAYLAAVVGIGAWFALRRGDSDDFMAASQSLPGWAVGLSMFGSYVSSISFLANPGKAYDGNWNAFVFSLATPIAAAIAVRWFVPFYRHTGEISAYEHLEHRFGLWARTYAVVCFLLTQMARTGTVIYLLALAVAPLTGWQVSTTIMVTGVLMTLYTMAGGIKAVVWTGVLQSAVLIAGTTLCVLVGDRSNAGRTSVRSSKPVGRNDKFSLGSFGTSLREPTFWVVFAYGLVINLGNFGTDQSYIQRYLTARSDREAVKSIWITTLLYVPTAAVFFFIGTALFVFYGAHPELLGGIEKADKVFPHFIATQLPVGLAGLVVAAIFAASMDSNLNSMATLTLCDLYKRYLRPAGDRTRINARALRGDALLGSGQHGRRSVDDSLGPGPRCVVAIRGDLCRWGVGTLSAGAREPPGRQCRGGDRHDLWFAGDRVDVPATIGGPARTIPQLLAYAT